MRCPFVILLALAACGGAPHPVATPEPTPPVPVAVSQRAGPRVIVVSVDGLLPASYLDPDAHGLAVPTLRAMRARGASSPGVVTVFPSVTYPAHTTMATGVDPASHGIVNNRSRDPLRKNGDGWYWYAEDIRVRTLWDAAEEHGLRTALINWPVTVGARVDALVPEYWRAGTADDVKLARALSTPGLLDAVAARYPAFTETFTPPDVVDSASFDIAVHLIETAAPDLMMIHVWMVDHFQHQKGPWSAEANAAVEAVDAQLARLIAACKDAGVWDETVLVVVSDHGFSPVTQVMRPGVALAEMDLVTLDDPRGKTLSAQKATVRANGGSAYVYLADEADEETAQLVRARFAVLAADPRTGIRAVLSSDDIRARGGDPAALLALDAEVGTQFSDDYTGDLVGPTTSAAAHGYDPLRPEMRASLLVHGPAVAPAELGEVRLVDLAPTVAGWLGLTLPDTAGRALPIELRSPPRAAATDEH